MKKNFILFFVVLLALIGSGTAQARLDVSSLYLIGPGAGIAWDTAAAVEMDKSTEGNIFSKRYMLYSSSTAPNLNNSTRGFKFGSSDKCVVFFVHS